MEIELTSLELLIEKLRKYKKIEIRNIGLNFEKLLSFLGLYHKLQHVFVGE